MSLSPSSKIQKQPLKLSQKLNYFTNKYNRTFKKDIIKTHKNSTSKKKKS